MDLVKLITDQLSGDALGELSSQLGTDSDTTRDATSAAVPAILAGLTGLAGSDDGARKLASTLNNLDSSASGGLAGLGNIANMLGGDASALQQKGGSLLASLFGDSLVSNIAASVGRYAGLDAAMTKKLLAWLMPLVLGFIGSKWKNQGGSIGGLASLLSDQRQNIAKAVPSGFELGSIPGLPSVEGAVRSAGQAVRTAGQTTVDAARRTGQAAEDTTRSLLTWLVPLAAVVLLIGALWYFFGRGPGQVAQNAANKAANTAAATGKAASDAASATDRAASDAATATGRAASDTASNVRTALRPELPDLPVPNLTAINKDLSGIFGSATQALGNIKDAASAQAALPELQQLSRKIDGIRDQLDSLPAAAQATLGTAVGDQFGALKAQADKILAMPGISDQARSALEGITSKLAGLNLAQVSKDATGVFTSLTKTLESFKDAASAEAALPKLEEASRKLDELTRIKESMSPGGQTMLGKLVAAARGPLEQLIDKILTQLGVDAVAVKPVLDGIVSKLTSLAAPPPAT
jgi:uncharacterized protein (UPF0333 family)